MKRIYLLIIVFSLSGLLHSQNAWINEFHYDNNGTDSGEFIEVVIEVSETYPYSNYSVTLYNGGDQLADATHNLETFSVGSSVNGFTFYHKSISGLQNDTDGFSLQYNGTLLQFLSYEGTFTALDGPANGILSTDIGVSESGSTVVGSSLGLTGNGTLYSDFSWTTFDDDSPGQPNGGDQTLPITLTEFTATLLYSEYVSIFWVTQSESNISHFNVYRDELFLGSMVATNTTSTMTYEYIDADIEDGAIYNYGLEAVELDGTTHNYGPFTVHIDFIGDEIPPPDLPVMTGLIGNYPNPFNPSTKIFFEVREGETADLSIFNVRGQLIEYNQFSAGSHEYLWLSESMESGLYFYKLDSPSYSRTKKMVILK